MRRLSQSLAVTMALMGVGAIPVVLQAQPPSGDSGDVNDPPSRAARLGMIQGNVSFQPGGVEDWVPATLNRPISTGDRLWTDAGARAELHLGSAAFRLNGRTNFTFVNLTDGLAQVQVSSGALSVRVRRLADQESIEIDTPQAAFSILRAGEYRIDVSEQGDSTIATVRAGDAEATAGGQSFTLHPRDQVRVSEENGQPVFDRRTAPVADGFDNFCQDRDRREDRSQSARYVSRDMPGYADLDDNGSWRDEPGYGMVWVPRVAVGWAPYHYGHWAWIEPWGWTWVDDAPWGYAPFHYGRWAFVGPAWVWVPGPVIVNVRPVYAPALVAWVGGSSWGVSIGVGPAVGWFPLGPREVWVPPYRYSPTYINQVNVTNTVIVNRTVINNVTVNNVNNVTYVNRNVPGAVTAVPQGAMVAGRPVAAAAVRVPPTAVAQAQVASYAAVAPQRGAVVGGRTVTGVAPPPVVANRTIVARTAPPPPPAAFNQRQTLLQQNPGQPLNRAQVSQIQQTQPPPARQAFRPALPQQPFPQGGQGGFPQRGGQGGGQVGGGQGQPPQVNPRPQLGQQTPGQQPVGQQPAGGQPAGGQRGNREVFGGQPAGGQPQGNPPPFQRQPQVQQPVPQPPVQNTAPPPARQVQENAPPPRRPQVQENAPPPRPQVQQNTPPPARQVPQNAPPPRPQVQQNTPPPARQAPQNAPPPRTLERGTPQGNPPPPRGGDNRRNETRDDKRDEKRRE